MNQDLKITENVRVKHVKDFCYLTVAEGIYKQVKVNVIGQEWKGVIISQTEHIEDSDGFYYDILQKTIRETYPGYVGETVNTAKDKKIIVFPEQMVQGQLYSFSGGALNDGDKCYVECEHIDLSSEEIVRDKEYKVKLKHGRARVLRTKLETLKEKTWDDIFGDIELDVEIHKNDHYESLKELLRTRYNVPFEKKK